MVNNFYFKKMLPGGLLVISYMTRVTPWTVSISDTCSTVQVQVHVWYRYKYMYGTGTDKGTGQYSTVPTLKTFSIIF